MKICWDNLEKLKYRKHRGDWRDNYYVTYIYKNACKNCNEPYLTRKNGKYCCHFCFAKNNKYKVKFGKKNPNWKGGYHINNIPRYNTYAPQLSWCEKVRRNIKDKNILEVKCAYCGKWYIPTEKEVTERIRAINGKIKNKNAEMRLYCSNNCKQECPIYQQKKWPKGFKIATSREVQPELRQIVLKRDNYKCVKCGSTKNLHCHHVEGIRWEPLESADIDKCITVCKQCHKKIHKKEGCKYHEFKCNKKDGDG